jgi:hypothetical protein
MIPTPKHWPITAPILLVLFFGGGFAGEQLAGVLASDSVLAKFIGFFALPTSMVLGFISWLGTASLIALKRRMKRNDKQHEVQREEYSWGQTTIPPGSGAFLIAAIIPCVIVGALVGLLSTEYGFVQSFISYTGMGFVYGFLCWKAAENGYLPFPKE